MNTTNGKIAEQSRQSLIKALLTVMEQYDYKEITVTQIAQEAGLSRKTFYRLFPGKEEILNLFLKETVEQFFVQLKEQQIHRYWEVVQLFFDFWEKQKSLLQLLKKHNLLFLLYEISYQSSFEMFQLVRSQQTASDFSETLPYLLSYSVGGMNSMLLNWVEDDMRIPSQILIEQLKKGYSSQKI